MARPALTEPPGELMYRLMSLRESSADSSSSCAHSRLATWSSTSVPRTMMRWNSSRLTSCSSRDTVAGGASATASFMISLLSVGPADRGLTTHHGLAAAARPGQSAGSRDALLPAEMLTGQTGHSLAG